ncbi:MAG: 3-oxoacyl-[acyl-carrier-protein] synthase III C-terminal domain-containing protein [Rhodothermales bacterium]
MQRIANDTGTRSIAGEARDLADPALVTTSVVLPDHVYSQEELIEGFNRLWADESHNPDLLRRFFESVQVQRRHLALPMEAYPALQGFTESNRAYIELGTDLAEKALRSALDQADVEVEQLDAIFFASVTGIAVPTIDARLVNRLKLRTDIKRTPLFGLGCVAGVAGISRMSDYLRAFPDHTAALLSLELCSLTLQKRDMSIPAIVAGGLFGDGAAAVIGRGGGLSEPEAPSTPRVIANKSAFYPDTEHVMGWEVGTDGFKVVLSADVPLMVSRYLKEGVVDFLAEHGLTTRDIDCWICHPGGPKVLEAMQRELDLPEGALDVTWKSLADIGNLSSASVLHVLHESIAQGRLRSGMYGLMIAMGPGFCSEMALLKCPA